MSPADSKQLVGEILYPKVYSISPENVGKLTGMLLELSNAELVNILNDEATLRLRVDEALVIYNDFLQKEGAAAAAGEKPVTADAAPIAV